MARESGACCASPTRGIISGGRNQPSNTALNSIDFITIATTGNATDFGDLTVARFANQSCSNSTRGLIFAGNNPSDTNVIDFITIASIGNAVDFGDTIEALEYPLGAVASPTRGVLGGGLNPSAVNTIQFVEIATTGDAKDFGDLQHAKSEASGCSNGHGGL